MQAIEGIGLRLKVARFVMGYQSAKAFAEAFDVRYTTYTHHEQAKKTVTLQRAYQYASFLKIDPIWLLTGRGDPCPTHPNAAEKKAEINALFHQLVFEKSRAIGFLPLALELNEAFINFSLWCDLLLRLDPTLKPKLATAIQVYNRLLDSPNTPETIEHLIATELKSLKKINAKK
jgi:hypothetical protein